MATVAEAERALTLRASDPAQVGSAELRVRIYLGFVVAWVAAQSSLEAMARPFRFDELCTWAVVRQRGVLHIWSALEHAVDGQPPLYYLIVELFARAIHRPELAYRFPSIVGVCASIICLYFIARRYTSASNSLLCSMAVLPTPLYHTFSVEGRPYALTAGCLAIAALCYLRPPSWRWTVLLCGALFLTAGIHYYGVLMFFPFLLTEAAFVLMEKNIRWQVWLAFAVGATPFFVSWPLLADFKAYYGAHFWSKPSTGAVLDAYGFLYHADGHAFASALVIVVIAGALTVTFLPRRSNAISLDARTIWSYSGWLLACGLFVLPLFVFLVALVGRGGFVSRYLLPAVLALPLSLAIFLSGNRTRLVRVAGCTVLGALLFVSIFEEIAYTTHVNYWRLNNPATQIEQLVDSAEHIELPVMISRPHDFLQLFYYGSPEFRNRLVRSPDVTDALALRGSDSDELEIALMRPLLGLSEPDWPQFVSAHPEFLLYCNSEPWDVEWRSKQLQKDGFSLRQLEAKGNKKVYLVTRPTYHP